MNDVRKFYYHYVDKLISLSRANKTFLVMLTDYIMLVVAFWVSLSLRDNAIYIPTERSSFLLILLTPLIALPIFYSLGLYRSLIRYSNYKSLITISLASLIYTMFWFIFVVMSSVVIKPFDFLLLNFLLTVNFTGAIRYLARWLLINQKENIIKVLIYGANTDGVQLRSAIWHSNDIKVMGFIDDDNEKIGTSIDGLRVFSKEQLSATIKKKNITEIFIAKPSAKKSEIQKIVSKLKKYSVIIKVMPSLSDIAKGTISINDLKKVKIEDLLKREIRKPNSKLLKQDINNRNVLVTGAGGSIGGELCRQIIKHNPKSLLLFDISEYALYKIERLLKEEAIEFPLLTIIGNVTNQSRLENLMTNYNVDTVYHTAAYKHVPMVEKNTIAGVRCNIFGTLSCCSAALNSNIESFVFVSTDKAVRPTNIMGATKRFAEMILQALVKIEGQDQQNRNTRVSIVRFGNVLGSSGSVVPLFEEQISKGGPLTVTDPNIIRYFMTIQEASQLVIQAGAMGVNGNIFVLDMGEPKKVLDLAEDMIQLSGMSVKNDQNTEGDIEIIYTGLRPGEKLFEELLIDKEAKPTKHHRIMQANDKGLSLQNIKEYLLRLEKAVEKESIKEIIEILSESVDGYRPYKSNI